MTDSKNPDAKRIDEMVESISDWLSKQPHLPHIEDKKLLMKFLVNCKFRLQETKNKIENYYSARTNIPSIFQDRDPCAPEIRKAAEKTPGFPLSQPTKDGHKVLFFKMTEDPDDFIPADWGKRTFMVLDAMFWEEAQNLNYVVLVDFRGFTFQHFLKMTNSAKLWIDIAQNVMPAKLKKIHYVHVPSFIDKMASFFKVLLKPKLQERFFVYKDIETFYEFIGNRDILPSDLGGKEPTIAEQSELWQKKMESYKSRFEQEEHIRSNENLRPPNSKSSFLMGTEGSFKKLSVD